ncbi:hypothetical protein KHA80_19510 [Anaerobacillus sp. HL2]|nr:hypothetical protein KHA80_19510 [Anaerobacillus sp. HL2]
MKGLETSTSIYIIDQKNRIILRRPGNYTIFASEFKYISFLSMYEFVTDLTLQEALNIL